MSNGTRNGLIIPISRINLSLEHIFVDEKKNKAGAILKAQAIDRANGQALTELGMNTLYNFMADDNKDIKISEARKFLESNPKKQFGCLTCTKYVHVNIALT